MADWGEARDCIPSFSVRIEGGSGFAARVVGVLEVCGIVRDCAD